MAMQSADLPASNEPISLSRPSALAPPSVAMRSAVEAESAAGLPLTALASNAALRVSPRSEEHTSELQSLMRSSYAVFCLKKKQNHVADSLYPLLTYNSNSTNKKSEIR